MSSYEAYIKREKRDSIFVLVFLFIFCSGLFGGIGGGIYLENQARFSKIEISETVVETIPNVVRVMMHEEGDYTIYILSDNKLLTRRLKVGGKDPDGRLGKIPEFFIDVPKEANSWVVVKKFTTTPGWENNYANWHSYNYEFHLHDPKEIDGGQWEKFLHNNNSKIIKGHTGVVE